MTAVLPNAAPTLPSVLAGGRYELHRELGTGGSARVFRARDTVRNTWVAIKVLRPEVEHAHGPWARFVAEAHMVSALAHPNLMGATDFQIHNDEEDVSFIVMDLVEGGSLRDRLRTHGPLDMDAAVRVSLDVLRGLGVVHQLGVVHRDVKPGNILLGSEGARLADFGIARHEMIEGTVAGVRLGTRGFAAPELRFGRTEVTPATDLFALGASLYVMLTGRSPEDVELDGVRSAAMAPLHPRVCEIILKAMSFDPSDRYQTARELAVDLLDLHKLLLLDKEVAPLADDWLLDFDLDLHRWSGRTIERSLIPVERICAPLKQRGGIPLVQDNELWLLTLATAVLGAIAVLLTGALFLL